MLDLPALPLPHQHMAEATHNRLVDKYVGEIAVNF
jgi:hypothetical protein